MLAFVCRVVVLISTLAATGSAAAQYAADDDWGPEGAAPAPLVIVAPMPAELGFATVGEMPWHPRRRVLPAGAVTLTAGYLAGLALGATSVLLDRGSACDDAIGGVQAIPVFGPIAAWVVSGMCRAQGLDALIHGSVNVLPALAQLAGFITLFVGAAGTRGGVALGPRVEIRGAGLAVTF